MSVVERTYDDRGPWLADKEALLGSSELPALMGISAYETPYSLFGRKTGLTAPSFPEVRQTETSISLPPHERGHLLEAPGIELARRLRPNWTILHNTTPRMKMFVDEDRRTSSTPDADVWEGGWSTVLQIKNVADHVFKRDWVSDGVVTPPLYAAMQATLDGHHAAAARGLPEPDVTYVGVFVVGFSTEFHLIAVPFKPALVETAQRLAAEFWRRVEGRDPYPADYARDGEAIAAIYRRVDPKAPALDLSGHNRIVSLCEEKVAWTRRRGNAERALETIDGEIRDVLRGSDIGVHPDWTITNKAQKRKAFSVPASETRVLRVKPMKVIDDEETV